MGQYFKKSMNIHYAFLVTRIHNVNALYNKTSKKVYGKTQSFKHIIIWFFFHIPLPPRARPSFCYLFISDLISY